MVRRLNTNYLPPDQQQQANMQFPPGPYNESEGKNAEEWQRYCQQEGQYQQAPPPYPPAYSPSAPPAGSPYGGSGSGNQGYYRPNYPPPQPYQYQGQSASSSQGPQGYHPYNNTMDSNQSQYPPYYSPQPEYPYGAQQPPHPYSQSPYGSPAPPTPSSHTQSGGNPYSSPSPYPPQPDYGKSPQPDYNTPQPSYGVAPTDPQAGEDKEKGLMGALAGGAAGAFAGHKMHHGFLGALGGAYAGHKLEDGWKEHRDKKNQSASPSPVPQPAPYQYPLQAPPIPIASRPPNREQPQQHHEALAGNFSASSSNINLGGAPNYELYASCGTISGSQHSSAISLNNVLTNDDGHFRWAENGNFGASARNVRLADGGRILEAELANCGGEWKAASVRLDERITNQDGEMRLV